MEDWELLAVRAVTPITRITPTIKQQRAHAGKVKVAFCPHRSVHHHRSPPKTPAIIPFTTVQKIPTIMDPLTNQALSSLLPPEMIEYLRVHVLHPQSPVQTILREASEYAKRGVDAVLPLVLPLLDRVAAAVSENQGAAGLVLVAIVLTVVVVVLNWIRRLMMWWTRLVTRILYYAFLVAVASAVWQRGIFQTAEDVVVFASKLMGYAGAVKDIWINEYNHYESQRVASASGQYSSHR